METNTAPIVIVSPGRLGDLVTAEAIFRKAHEAEPERPVIFYTRPEFAAVMEHCPYISRIVHAEKDGFTGFEEKFPAGSKFIKVNVSDVRMPEVSRPGLDQTWNLLNRFQNENSLPLQNDVSKFYLKSTERFAGLPEKYIVFHCCSNGKSRQWPLKNWRKLAEFCIKEQMPVVEIGFGSVIKLDLPGYFDCCALGDLQDTAAIINHAQAMIGVESGMLHIANALDVFGFVVSGALHDVPEYNHYCGKYYERKNCNILRYFGRNPFELPYSTVERALEAFLDDTPLTAAECDMWCYRKQLEEEQNKWFSRLVQYVRLPWLKLEMARQFHCRPRR